MLVGFEHGDIAAPVRARLALQRQGQAGDDLAQNGRLLRPAHRREDRHRRQEGISSQGQGHARAREQGRHDRSRRRAARRLNAGRGGRARRLKGGIDHDRGSARRSRSRARRSRSRARRSTSRAWCSSDERQPRSAAGLAFPLRVDRARRPRARRATSDDIDQAIQLILGTAPGERPMRPEFGCGVHDFVFDVDRRRHARPHRARDPRRARPLGAAHRRRRRRLRPRRAPSSGQLVDRHRLPGARDQRRAQPRLSRST